jgi:hypothetical protein
MNTAVLSMLLIGFVKLLPAFFILTTLLENHEFNLEQLSC